MMYILPGYMMLNVIISEYIASIRKIKTPGVKSIKYSISRYFDQCKSSPVTNCHKSRTLPLNQRFSTCGPRPSVYWSASKDYFFKDLNTQTSQYWRLSIVTIFSGDP